MVIQIIRRFMLVLTCAALTIPLGACTGPGGVDLGKNWAGSEVFVLSKLNGLVAVVGIDPTHHTAEPLAVIPSQSDDDNVLSPRITRLADGRWVVTVPKKGGRPSSLYQVNVKDRVLDGLGTVEGGRALFSAGAFVAAVGDRSQSSTGKANVLVYDPTTWQVQRVVDLPIDPATASGGRDGLCIGTVGDAETQVAHTTLGEGSAPTIYRVPELKAQSLDCADGRPIVGGNPGKDGETGASAKLTLTTVNGVVVVSTAAGRVDRVLGDGDSIAAAVSLPGHIDVVELARDGGRELRRVTVSDIGEVSGMRKTPQGWVLTSGSRVATVDLAAGRADAFKLPGELLSAG
jgi:hypothetical protein